MTTWAGCTNVVETGQPTPPAATAGRTQTPIIRLRSISTSTRTPTLATTPSSTAAAWLCSPLKDIPLAQIARLVSNPYHPPRPGYDDPHAGVDLAVRLLGSQVAVAGHTVQAALAGRVAMVTHDRFPFGNAVLIETPLDSAPASWQAYASLPTPAPTVAPVSALTCPASPTPVVADAQRRSLYVLYAHLKEPSLLQSGDVVTCGQPIGLVGSSGNALNPHLHFETRVAPAGLRISSMAHYDASATPEEMSNYCLWSVSGLFQLADPLKVLNLVP